MALVVVELQPANLGSKYLYYWSIGPSLCALGFASDVIGGMSQRAALRRWAKWTNGLRFRRMCGFSADDVMDQTLARQSSSGESHGVACTRVSTTTLVVAPASPATRGHRHKADIDKTKDFLQTCVLPDFEIHLTQTGPTTVSSSVAPYVDRCSHTTAESSCIYQVRKHTVQVPEDMDASHLAPVPAQRLRLLRGAPLWGCRRLLSRLRDIERFTGQFYRQTA